MKTLAAVLVETGKPLELVELEIPQLKPGQVLVKIAYSGVCHTQVLESRGYRGEDKYVPHCLGHEGSGVVHEIGTEVKKVKKGDKVILSWIQGSGANVPGTVYKWGDRNVNSGAITTFSHYSVISENRLTPIQDTLPMREAALIGCAVPTGVGSIFNTAQPRPGQSIAIFGSGGIGLSAIAGAAVAGCMPIIAIDRLDSKLEIAHIMGATHFINVTHLDPVEEIKRLLPGGVDFAIEATGLPQVMRQAMLSVRNQGGTAVVIGNAHFGSTFEVDPLQFNLGKRIFGTWGGDNVPDRDYPRYSKLMTAGKLKFQAMTDKSYRLEEINQAIDDLEDGKVIRPIIQM